MNLLQDAWLPYRLSDGSTQWLPLNQISNPEVIDFALPRADFQGAAYQFAIGILQTIFAPEDADEWFDRYQTPPTKESLQTAFSQIEHAFNLTGDKAFMQDLDPLSEQELTSISGLLIDAPGAISIKKNIDFFVKRGGTDVMSAEMAALALFTLQINAPSGGSGHRTGLRGGGPLTTLVMPSGEQSSLWQKLWLNVINRDFWRYETPDFTDGSVFPWLIPSRESSKGTKIYPEQAHLLQMYWAMPRRIRLKIDQTPAICAVSGQEKETSVTAYQTKNYGNNYAETWLHSLTPYRFDPKKTSQPPLSVKGQPNGITYKIWDSLTFVNQNEGLSCAKVVQHYNYIQARFEQIGNSYARLWVFGYDMDNMKARGWYSTVVPILQISPELQDNVLSEIQELQNIANKAIQEVCNKIKSVWFFKPSEVKGDTSFIDLAFWQRTESSFYQVVTQIQRNLTADSNAPALTSQQAKHWLNHLRNTCIQLLDDYLLSDFSNSFLTDKQVRARKMLLAWFKNGKVIKHFKENYIEQEEQS